MVTKMVSTLGRMRAVVKAGGLEKNDLHTLEEQVSILHADVMTAIEEARGRGKKWI